MRAFYLDGFYRRTPVFSHWSRPRRRSLTAAGACAVFLLLFCLYSRPQVVLAGTPQPLHESVARTPVDVVSHGMTLSRDHGFLILTGEARNVSRREMPQLEAVVELLDENGRLVEVETGLVKVGSIAAGDEAPFEVQAKDNASISSYRVRFKNLSGTSVSSRSEA